MKVKRANFVESGQDFESESSSDDTACHIEHLSREPLEDEIIWGEPMPAKETGDKDSLGQQNGLENNKKFQLGS